MRLQSGPCRVHNTEMSKAMESPALQPMQWPSQNQRHGASAAGGSAAKGALAGGLGAHPEHAAARASPLLGRLLLRGSHHGSADSLVSSEPGI